MLYLTWARQNKETQEMWVWSLGWEDPLEEKEMATHSSIVTWKNLMDKGAWWATVHGVAEQQTHLGYHFLLHYYLILKRMVKLTHATVWMNLEDIMLSEMSQLQKDRYYMIPLIWAI